jgi:hypothetical protein
MSEQTASGPPSADAPAAFYCPSCGREYPEDGSCSVDHPNVDHLEPIENKPADLLDPTQPVEPEPEADDGDEVDPADGTEAAPDEEQAKPTGKK